MSIQCTVINPKGIRAADLLHIINQLSKQSNKVDGHIVFFVIASRILDSAGRETQVKWLQKVDKSRDDERSKLYQDFFRFRQPAITKLSHQ